MFRFISVEEISDEELRLLISKSYSPEAGWREKEVVRVHDQKLGEEGRMEEMTNPTDFSTAVFHPISIYLYLYPPDNMQVLISILSNSEEQILF